jgi:hypothetical protein
MMLGDDSVNTASSYPLPETRTMSRSFCTAVMLALGTSVPLWAQATDSAPPSVPRPAPKVNIWPARSVSIPADPKAKPIRIGIWDSGVDTALFAGRLARNARGSVLLRGYDSFKQRQDTPLEVLPPALLARQDELNAATMALDDLDTFVSSPAARALTKRMAAMTPAERKLAEDEMGRWTGYTHGTSVADAALVDHGQAEIVIARMEWWHGDPPVPCWTRALADREAASIQDLLTFLVASGSRVVNMSWGRYERSYLRNLEQCAPTMSVEERAAIARYSVDTVRAALRAGMLASPQVLFVGAAGNEGKSVAQSNPATRLDVSNFVLVGAVNDAGDLPAFTNVGPEVALFAHGWRIPTRLPGGVQGFATGTSFAAPLVSNTAAKMLVVNPKLSGADLRRLLLATADTNAKGLKLMHAANAVAAARVERK